MLEWLRSFFGPTGPPTPPGPPAKVKGYGFPWVPNTAFNRLQFMTITDQSPPNLYVMILPQAIECPRQYFKWPSQNIEVIFSDPDKPDPKFEKAMQGVLYQGQEVTTFPDLMKWFQGFLQYTHYCLNYIYATSVGKTLLNDLKSATRPTYITPAAVYNNVHGLSLCLVAEMVRDFDKLDSTQRAELIRILEQAAGAQGLHAFTWLATKINQMPLYSMFEQSNAYPPAFLQTSGAPVTARELQRWFNTGKCNLVKKLEKNKIQNVYLLDFIKNAVIILLHEKSPKGAPVESTIGFDVHKWPADKNGLDQIIINSKNDRPPVIGLAHELIHAYHNVKGDQPGIEYDTPSTTLFELLCVGLGPWANDEVTENAIRRAWPPSNVLPSDELNNRRVPQRTVYVAPGEGKRPQDMRKRNTTKEEEEVHGPI